MNSNIGDARVSAPNPYLDEQREQTVLLRQIRNGVSLLAVFAMLIVLMVLIGGLAAAG